MFIMFMKTFGKLKLVQICLLPEPDNLSSNHSDPSTVPKQLGTASLAALVVTEGGASKKGLKAVRQA